MKTRSLLYLDDEKEIAQLVKIFFQHAYPTYEVIAMTNAADALEELRQRAGRRDYPRALVTDLNLGPPLDGAALVKKVRAEFPKLRTIIVSGVDLQEYAERAAGAGADAFMLKCPDLNHFVRELMDKLDTPSDVRPELAYLS